MIFLFCRYDRIVTDVAAEFPEMCRCIEGTVTHETVLGDCLEGLVIHAFMTAPDRLDVPQHDEIAAAIEAGKTSVVKYKFPHYTVRTMCIRTALGQRGYVALTPSVNVSAPDSNMPHCAHSFNGMKIL